eukprot:66530-Pleurochrysis_carterae.AAC.3
MCISNILQKLTNAYDERFVPCAAAQPSCTLNKSRARTNERADAHARARMPTRGLTLMPFRLHTCSDTL